MSDSEYRNISNQLREALEVAEQEMLQIKARRGETLVLWNSKRQQTEHILAQDLLETR